jgi:hypothetical protein
MDVNAKSTTDRWPTLEMKLRSVRQVSTHKISVSVQGISSLTLGVLATQWTNLLHTPRRRQCSGMRAHSSRQRRKLIHKDRQEIKCVRVIHCCYRLPQTRRWGGIIAYGWLTPYNRLFKNIVRRRTGGTCIHITAHTKPIKTEQCNS